MRYFFFAEILLRFVVLVLLIIATSTLGHAAIVRIYVDQSATSGQQNGDSWQNAYTDIESALEHARNLPPTDFIDIWIAGGVYKPSVDIGGGTNSGTANYTFYINANVNLHGGFAGNETLKSERVKYKHPTVLSGDVLGDDIYTKSTSSQSFPADNITDNSYNILRVSDDLNTYMFFSQLTFRGGNAAHPETLSKRRGGAVWYAGFDTDMSLLTLDDCIFEYNSAIDRGGALGVFGRTKNSPVSVVNCQFQYNKSLNDGGAISIDGVSQKECFPVKINDVVFYKNVSLDDGGAIYYDATASGCITTDLTNCTFNQNKAGSRGGGFFAVVDDNTSSSFLDVVNTILWDNEDGSGSNSYVAGDFPVEMKHSIFPESIGDNKNSADDPLFRNAPQGNLKLKKKSPAREAGVSTSFGPAGRDVEGLDRLSGSAIDIGAYEYLKCPSSKIIYVDSRYRRALAPKRNDGRTSATAFRELDKGLELACDCNGVAEIQLAKGSYVPSRDLFGVPGGRYNQFVINGDVSIIGNAENPFYDSIYASTTPFYRTIITGDVLGDDDGTLATEEDEYDNVFILMRVLDESNSFEIRDVDFEGASYLTGTSSSNAFSTGLLLSNFNSDCNRLVEDCEFRRNRSRTASALYCGNALDSTNVVISKCFFSRNTSLFSTLYISNSSPIVQQCFFSTNEGSSTLFVYGIDGGDARPVISNNIFTEFRIGDRRFIDVDSEFGSTTTTVSNCTFSAQDTASVHVRDNIGMSNLIIRNSILNNVELTRGSNESTTLDVSHSVIKNEECPSMVNCGNVMYYNQEIALTDYSEPIPGSLAIDMGTHVGVDIPMTDYNGQPRIRNNKIDIGAVEFREPCPTTLVLDKMLSPFDGQSILRGTWDATDSIIVKAGFAMSDEIYLNLNAPNIEFEGSFEKMNMSDLEVTTEACDR